MMMADKIQETKNRLVRTDFISCKCNLVELYQGQK